MMNVPRWMQDFWRRTSLVFFIIFICFWIIKLVYCGYGYFTNGVTGLQNAIIHGSLVPRDPKQWGNPRWDMIALQYSGIALLTVLFGLDNRTTLNRLWNAVWHRTPPKRDS